MVRRVEASRSSTDGDAVQDRAIKLSGCDAGLRDSAERGDLENGSRHGFERSAGFGGGRMVVWKLRPVLGVAAVERSGECEEGRRRRDGGGGCWKVELISVKIEVENSIKPLSN